MLYTAFYSFLQFQAYIIWKHFPLARRVSFSISFSMFARHAFSHLLSVLNCVYFAFLFKAFFCYCWIWNASFFSFSTLKTPFYCLLVSIVSNKKSAMIFVFCLFVTCLFSVSAFKILFLFFIFHQKFGLMYWGMVYFEFIFVGFSKLLESMG